MQVDYNTVLFERCHEWIIARHKEGMTWEDLKNLNGTPEQAEVLFHQLRIDKCLPADIGIDDWEAYIQLEQNKDSALVLVAIFEQQPENRKRLSDYLMRYSIQRDADLERLWFEDSNAVEKLKKYAAGFHIAFISLDDDDAIKIGAQIYDCNPNCLICYYKKGDYTLRPLLNSRPYEFYTWEQEEKGFFHTLDKMIFRAMSEAGNFLFETKKCLYCYPINNILYFQSNLKYVFIQTVLGNDANIYAKLSDVENILKSEIYKGSFLRIHKSYIVNRKYIHSIDKQHHTVKLANEENLPISEAHYQEVLKALQWL